MASGEATPGAASAARRRRRARAAQFKWLIDIAKLIATGAAAAIATIMVGYFGFFNTGREIDIKMVDISLAILAGERGGVDAEVDDEKVYAEYRLARVFALRALRQYAKVALSDTEIEEWASSGKLKFGDVPEQLTGGFGYTYTPTGFGVGGGIGWNPYGFGGYSGIGWNPYGNLADSAGAAISLAQWEQMLADAAAGPLGETERCKTAVAGLAKSEPTGWSVSFLRGACAPQAPPSMPMPN